MNVTVERTYVMIKPDAVSRGLVGEIISRFERKGFKIKALKMFKFTRELAEEFYAEHKGKHFFNDLIEFITSGPVVAMVLEGENAVETVRIMIGITDGRRASPGSIRGDYALDITKNVVHASDSLKTAEREINLIFKPNEIVD